MANKNSVIKKYLITANTYLIKCVNTIKKRTNSIKADSRLVLSYRRDDSSSPVPYNYGYISII